MKVSKCFIVRLLSAIKIKFKFLLLFLYFTLKNRKFWREKSLTSKSKNVIVAENSDNSYLSMGVSVLANIVAFEKKATVLYLSYNNGYKTKTKWIKKSFGYCYFENIVNQNQEDLQAIEQTAKSILANVKSPKDLLNVYYKNILIGDLIYDSILVEGCWQASVWVVDDKTLVVTIKYIKLIYTLEKIERKYNVKGACFSHNIGMPALVLRYFTSKGATTYAGIIGSGPIKKYTSFKGVKLPYVGTIRKEFVTNLTREDEQGYLIKAKKYLQERVEGKLSDLDSPKAFLQEKKLYKSKFDFCSEFNLDVNKPLVFIMLHAFNDYPHHFNEYIFNDYYHWFIETLKIANKNVNVNWVFKQHPTSIFYPDDANLRGIFEVNQNSNILFFDTDFSFNTLSLKNIADTIITSGGTVGMEMSCYGVPVIIASDTSYSDFEFCYQVKSFREYEKLLANLHSSPLAKLDKTKREKALLVLYFQSIISGITSNNSCFIPQDSHEEKKKNNVDKVLRYYIDQLKKDETKNFIQTFRTFINCEKSELFFSDPDLIKIEASIANDKK